MNNTDSFFPTRLSNIDEFFQGRLMGKEKSNGIHVRE